jgi:hypothetical protein
LGGATEGGHLGGATEGGGLRGATESGGLRGATEGGDLKGATESGGLRAATEQLGCYEDATCSGFRVTGSGPATVYDGRTTIRSPDRCINL